MSEADEVIWHDTECAAYTADLGLWHELAAEAAGPVLDLGCGTGRVALDLAAAGHAVTAVDSEPELVRALSARARRRGLRVDAHVLDVRTLALGRTFALAIAPMQVVQLLGGPAGRRAMLAAVRRHLDPGGRLAAALADPYDDLPADLLLPPLPDVREQDGWIYQSRPISVRDEDGALVIDRLRETVSPDGSHRSSVATIRLDRVDPATLEREGREHGFVPRPARRVPETEAYVGSTVVILEAA